MIGQRHCLYNKIAPAPSQHHNFSSFSMDIGYAGTWNIHRGIIPSVSDAYCRYLSSKSVFSIFPKKPPDGAITATVMFFIILGIFSVMSASCCIRIGKYSALLNIKRMYDNGWSRASSILLLLSIWCARSPSLQSHQGLHVFAVSEAAREDSNDAITFNTDSSFWVCDNSATGHICNNKLLFDGTLVQS